MEVASKDTDKDKDKDKDKVRARKGGWRVSNQVREEGEKEISRRKCKEGGKR